jgi:hypothetical protein
MKWHVWNAPGKDRFLAKFEMGVPWSQEKEASGDYKLSVSG